MYEIRDSIIHGKGVFARNNIASGKRIGRFQARRTSKDGMHVLWIENDDGQWQGYEGIGRLRFLNHSIPANSEFEGLDLYAIRDINKGEEITIDYGDEFAED